MSILEDHMRHLSFGFLMISALSLNSDALCAQSSWTAVERTIGRSGVPQAGDVLRFNFPRSDLRVVLDGVQLRPNLVLRSWVSFKRMPDGQSMIMGDLVLAEDEINPVISALQQGGVEQTALHNHLVGARPGTMNLHIAGHGPEQNLANTIRRAMEITKTPLDTAGAGGSAPFDVDTVALARALGYTGRVAGGVYQVGVPRLERVSESGQEIPGVMGLATVINFQSTGGGKAAIAGDFVMTEAEVNPVIRALRGSDIGITALHSHMLGESPRLYFMHFWANDDALKLARGLRNALAQTNSVKASAAP
jgi:hypothetical protein